MTRSASDTLLRCPATGPTPGRAVAPDLRIVVPSARRTTHRLEQLCPADRCQSGGSSLSIRPTSMPRAPGTVIPGTAEAGPLVGLANEGHDTGAACRWAEPGHRYRFAFRIGSFRAAPSPPAATFAARIAFAGARSRSDTAPNHAGTW